MASAQASQHLFANHLIQMFEVDPDDTNPTEVSWVDMRDYSEIGIMVMTSVLGGAGPDAFTIIANSDSAGGGTDATIKVHAVGSPPDAIEDHLVLSCTAEEIRQEETSSTGQLRYVTAVVTMDNAGDEAVVTYNRVAKRSTLNLTADVVA